MADCESWQHWQCERLVTKRGVRTLQSQACAVACGEQCSAGMAMMMTREAAERRMVRLGASKQSAEIPEIMRARSRDYRVQVTDPVTRKCAEIAYVRAVDGLAAADVVKTRFPGMWVCAEGWNPSSTESR